MLLGTRADFLRAPCRAATADPASDPAATSTCPDSTHLPRARPPGRQPRPSAMSGRRRVASRPEQCWQRRNVSASVAFIARCAREPCQLRSGMNASRKRSKIPCLRGILGILGDREEPRSSALPRSPQSSGGPGDLEPPGLPRPPGAPAPPGRAPHHLQERRGRRSSARDGGPPRAPLPAHPSLD